jgi:hypothetical protein
LLSGEKCFGFATLLLHPHGFETLFSSYFVGVGVQVEGVDEKCKGSGACSGYE